ncbi:MAG TPA: bifunctional lysylphosphatidylglycerol flippase/synthetase MprF [Fibrobacteria bacterium]|nr:bifunctional lysylphosphatidylglycerol flippase/synthetase MprF [Fibrobacteria bacterium]
MNGAFPRVLSWTRKLAPVLALALFAAALRTLHGELEGYNYRDILRHIREAPPPRILLALAFTCLSYLLLTGFDFLGLKYIGKQVPYRKTALVAFISYAFTNSLGFSTVTGGVIRYRLYSAFGLTLGEIARVVGFCAITFWVGVFLAGGLALTWEPLALPDAHWLPLGSTRPLGALFLILAGAYFLAAFLLRRTWTLRGWEVSLPRPRIAAGQFALALADWSASAMVFRLLLPPSLQAPFLWVTGAFLISHVLGLISNVPGGLGVFESAMLLMLKPYAPAPQLVGSLVLYRILYYLVPLGLATLSLAGFEAYLKKERLAKGAAFLDRWLFPVMPMVYSVLCFLGGALLLFSGSTPGLENRMRWLSGFVPLPVLESSHLLASIAGAVLLVVALGLYRRSDAAYHAALSLLAAGMLLSLLKGLDYEEALGLGVLLLTLWPAHRHFQRRSSLFGASFTSGWLLAVGLVFTAAIWLGLFSYKHVEYSHELWWRFSVDGNASRFLRATVGAASFVLVAGLSHLLAPAPFSPRPPDGDGLEKAAAIVRASPRSGAGLALSGDKALMFSPSGKSFIMYGVEGRSWVALGDPVGAPEEFPELVWRFKDACDEYGARPVFYQAEPACLPLYVDIGLSLLKLGEEARVDLQAFSLQGVHGKKLRYALRRAEKEGLVFEIAPREAVPGLLRELRDISDEWLRHKHTREKGFSLGHFDAAYLARFPIGLIRKHGVVLAFANVLAGADKRELSIDLMRHRPSDSKDAMEFLFAQLMLWGKADGFAWFNLGMAPLSGLDNRPLAPLWNRVGAVIFNHGEHFYNFQGLRRFKERFDPVWEPRFLASPSGFALPRILANIASLISGGMKGVLGK